MVLTLTPLQTFYGIIHTKERTIPFWFLGLKGLKYQFTFLQIVDLCLHHYTYHLFHINEIFNVHVKIVF